VPGSWGLRLCFRLWDARSTGEEVAYSTIPFIRALACEHVDYNAFFVQTNHDFFRLPVPSSVVCRNSNLAKVPLCLQVMADQKASPTPSPPLSGVSDEKGIGKRTRPWFLVGSITVAAVIVLGLALGLGLGLGLKKHSNKASTQSPGVVANSSSPNAPYSYASSNISSLRSETQNYNLGMTDWDIAAPPATRTYNLTLSEIDAAPDGRRLWECVKSRC
jgi:hypothetical protein